MENKKILQIVLLIIIFLIPLMGLVGDFGYEEIKVFSFILLSVFAGIFYLGKDRFKWSTVKVSSLIFILSLGVASIFGQDPKISFLGLSPYFQGWILYLLLFLISLLLNPPI